MSYWRAATAPAPVTQPGSGPHRTGTAAVFVWLLARTGGFSDPTRRLLRRRMSSARPASAQQTRCSDHPRLGENPGLSPVLDGRAVELRRALSRRLLGEKLRSFPKEKWRLGSRCRRHFMDITLSLGVLLGWETSSEGETISFYFSEGLMLIIEKVYYATV